MFQVAYTYNTTNSAECRLFGLSELNFIDELRKEQASQQQHYAHYKYYDFVWYLLKIWKRHYFQAIFMARYSPQSMHDVPDYETIGTETTLADWSAF